MSRSTSGPTRPTPPGTWAPARAAALRLLSPIQRFLEIEAASGLVLMGAAVLALVWANSPWAASYQALFHTDLPVAVGSWSFERPLQFWVNDGLMTIFFFVVGLEIRSEMAHGELRDRRRAALPLIAALGGMLAPAAIYAAINVGRAGAAGWGVPMATDIAFAVGVLALLGRRVASAARVLVLALAVIDDIGAIAVIALFYSADITLQGLALAAAGIALVALLKAIGVRMASIYVAPGAAVWIGLHRAGIHPTLAGVILGLLTPTRARGNSTDEPDPASPAQRLQHHLHRWVAFLIMPLFALANAGVTLGGASLQGDAALVFLGIVAGLVAGKPLGVFLACRGGARTGIATIPDTVSRGGLAVAGIVAGIGFTMSLFIAHLAFPPGPLLETAKLAILTGSSVAGAAGLAIGAAILPRHQGQPIRAVSARRGLD